MGVDITGVDVLGVDVMVLISLKCVHSLLGKQEALATMGKSLEKDSLKRFSFIGRICSYRANLS